MVGVPMIVVLVVSILRHITPRSETLDQKTYNAFVDDIEQIRFRAWSSTWLLCGCCATVVFFATGLRHLALSMGASSICWICLKVGLAKKSINFEIAAKGFPLVHVWYMLISEFLLFAFAFMEILLLFVKKGSYGAGPNAFDMFVHYHGVTAVLVFGACCGGWKWALFLLSLCLIGMFSFFAAPPSVELFPYQVYKDMAQLLPVLTALTVTGSFCVSEQIS